MKINHSTQHELKYEAFLLRESQTMHSNVKKIPLTYGGGIEMQQHYNYLI